MLVAILAALAALAVADPAGSGQIVRAEDGTLAEGYVAGRACTAEPRRCGPYILEVETGAVVMFDGDWSPGFEETGRGQEVRKRPAHDRGEGRG